MFVGRGRERLKKKKNDGTFSRESWHDKKDFNLLFFQKEYVFGETLRFR